MTDPRRDPIEAAPPRPSAAEVRRLLAAELSLPSRLLHTLLLVASLGMAGVTGALLLTEAGLPVRTRVALGVLASIGLAWSAFAAWVLARRRVLLAGHRVMGAGMAFLFSAVFTAGAWGVGRLGDGVGPWRAAVGVGVVMMAASAVLLVLARRRVAALSRRRLALERRLAGGGGAS